MLRPSDASRFEDLLQEVFSNAFPNSESASKPFVGEGGGDQRRCVDRAIREACCKLSLEPEVEFIGKVLDLYDLLGVRQLGLGLGLELRLGLVLGLRLTFMPYLASGMRSFSLGRLGLGNQVCTSRLRSG